MNFSNTKVLRRSLSLFIAGIMVLSLFTGCVKKPAEDTTPSDTQSNINLVEDTKPSETEPSVPETTEPVITDHTARVTSQLSIRNTPSKDGGTIGTLDAGDLIEVMRTSEVAGVLWGLITEPVSGWICMDYVTMLNPNSDLGTSTPAQDSKTDDETTKTDEPQSFKGVITVNDLNIRNEPKTGTVVGQYDKGDVVTILETKDGWGRTSLGWISLDYVNSATGNTGTTGNTNNNNNNNTTNNTTTGNTGNTTTGTTNVSGDGSTKVIAKGVVTASDLNVRASASKDSERIKSLSYGTRVEIYEKKDGWGRTKDGWISLSYVYIDGEKGTKTAKGIVTTDGLNIRTGPGTKYDTAGSYAEGDRVEILEQFKVNDVTWGCTSKGWISMSYVYVDGTDVGESGNGTVNTDNLNVRSGPGTKYDSVGHYNEGDVITILYQVDVGDTTWGCTEDGWISLDYVDLD